MEKFMFKAIKEEKLVNIEKLLIQEEDFLLQDYDNPFAYLNDYDVDSRASIRYIA